MEAQTGRGIQLLNSMSRVSWGAIWAGVFVAMFFQLLLGLLGLAIGLTVVDVGQQSTGMAVGAGVWLLVSTLTAVFLGAFTAGRLAGLSAKYDGLLHGVITLAFLVVLSLFLAVSGISSALTGIFGLTLRATQVPQIQQVLPQGTAVQQQISQQQPQITQAQRQQAQAVATQTAWWSFTVGLLALVVAMIGGYIGMQSRVRQVIRETA
jgi:hypothetical protein